MAKINATYGSGVYLSDDFDYRKLEEQRKREKRERRSRKGRDGGDDEQGEESHDEVKRQTFAIPFDLICTLCHRRVVRGSHVYVNRRATKEKYLGSIRIWELEFHCKFCDGLLYLLTDPETPKLTGGYRCAKNCERTRGDLYEMNRKNEAIRAQWEKEKSESELNPLEAMERENEAARRLAEMNRAIEEHVDNREAQEDRTLDLLRAVRARRGSASHAGDSRGLVPLGHVASYTPGLYASDVTHTEQDDNDFDAFTESLSALGGGVGAGAEHEGESERGARADRSGDDEDDHDTSAEDRDSRHSSGSGDHSNNVDDDLDASSSSRADADQLARALSRYGGGGDLEQLMAAPASSSTEHVLSRSGDTGSQTATTPTTHPAGNVFLDGLASTDDSDSDSVEDIATPPPSRTTPTPLPRARAQAAPRSLLTQLDTDDDDDD